MEMRRKIVYFDSDSAYARKVKEYLTIEGFDVVWKDHVPPNVAELVLSEQPSVVVLDAYLPNDDGFRVAHHLKSDLRIQRIPIIFLSSLGHVSDRQSGFDAGAADYVVKSAVALPDFVARINRILGRLPKASAPRVRIADLPDLAPTPQLVNRREVGVSIRGFYWIAGIAAVIAVGVWLSFVFSARQRNASVSEIPLEYLDPSACYSDDDCHVAPGCCPTTALNLYHFQNVEDLHCPAVQCSSTAIGVACINRRCEAVNATWTSEELITYGDAYSPTANEPVWAYDCERRGGIYHSCMTTCEGDNTSCAADQCVVACTLTTTSTLPSPVNR
jgi:CheY-like chemotaxis protein